jgi:hypothetical protein
MNSLMIIWFRVSICVLCKKKNQVRNKLSFFKASELYIYIKCWWLHTQNTSHLTFCPAQKLYCLKFYSFSSNEHELKRNYEWNLTQLKLFLYTIVLRAFDFSSSLRMIFFLLHFSMCFARHSHFTRRVRFPQSKTSLFSFNFTAMQCVVCI